MTLTKEKKTKRIPRAETAESVGVSSKEVQAFIDDCEKEGIELHSLMVLRHGKVACEAFREPYSADYSHMMYSVSKSVTSIAIGFAVEEGLLSLETKFLDVFPYMRPVKYDPYLEKLNVLHLLTMRSGKSVSPMSDRTKDTWLNDFVSSPWVSEPGTEFKYISENMYVLCSMIKAVTGQSVTEFLTPRLYEPLGIETPYWETCPSGIETGGWGIFLTLEDLGKFTLCCQQMGIYDGKQVIPRSWIEEGTKALTESTGESIDSKCGYGYCFWRCSGENAYRADGMFSQFGIVFEDYDAAFCMQGGNIDEQQTRDCIWRHFAKAFDDNAKPEDAVELKITPYEKLPASPRSILEESIDGMTINFGKAHVLNIMGMPVSILPLAAVFMEKDKAGVIDNVKLSFREDRMIMTWTEGDEMNTIPIGMEGDYLWGKIILGGVAYNTASVGAWTGENTLEVHIRVIETVAERRLVFKFKDGGKVDMEPSTVPPSSVMLDNVKSSVKGILPSEFIANLAERVIPLANPFADPVHHGKIKQQPEEESK